MMRSMRAQILIPFHHEVHESSSWMGLEGGRGCMGGKGVYGGYPF